MKEIRKKPKLFAFIMTFSWMFCFGMTCVDSNGVKKIANLWMGGGGLGVGGRSGKWGWVGEEGEMGRGDEGKMGMGGRRGKWGRE